jgi:acetylornithine deacetylase/succinyl-diaminopimelate desuccinylase-like protein
MSMVKETYQAYLRDHTAQIVEDLRTLVAQPSVSAENIGMSECANLVAQMLSRAGVTPRLIPTAGYPVVFGELKSPGAMRTILVYGHYDVQPPEPLDEWRVPPYSGHIEDGRLYGRGCADDKGQFFTQIKAVEVLNHTVGKCPVNLKFIFEGEEEIGSPNLVPFVTKNRPMLAADGFFRADGNKHESGRPLIKLGQKGMLYLELSRVSGTRDLHSSRSPVSTNPVWRLTQALHSLYDPKLWRILVDGFYDKVLETTAKDHDFISAIPFRRNDIEADMGTPLRSDLRGGADYYEAFLLNPHLTICGFHAGYGGVGVKTIVPRAAAAKVDIRLAPKQDPDEIAVLVRSHLDRHGFGDVQLKVLAKIRPARTPSADPYVGRVIESLRSVYGEEPVVYPSSEGSGPAYIFRELLSLPYVIVPCAQFDCRMHAPNENIELSGMMKGIELFIDVMYRESQVSETVPGKSVE